MGLPPLVVSLANTGEPLYLLNRSANRPSHERADEYLDKAVALCRRGGFQRICFAATPISCKPGSSTNGTPPAM